MNGIDDPHARGRAASDGPPGPVQDETSGDHAGEPLAAPHAGAAPAPRARWPGPDATPSWSDRQLALLREMGLTLWWPGAAPRSPARSAAQPSAADGDGPADARREASAAARQSDAPAAHRPGARPAGGGDVAASHPQAAAQPAGPGPLATDPHGAPAGSSQPARPGSAPTATSPRPAPLPEMAAARADGPAVDAPPSGLRPAGIAQMDWPALRQAVAGCTACDLCRSRTQTVFGVGNERAHWMVVGEAPGEQEDAQGEPFVGRSGQLLDRMLAAIGLTRAEAPPEQQVFIANTLKCRPPGNRNPQPAEMAQCEPYLLRQIELVQPRIILAMGRFAVQSLLRSDQPIGRLRGQVHRYHGVPLIVTYHPAYLLRNPADKAAAWSDLCLARATLAGGPAG